MRTTPPFGVSSFTPTLVTLDAPVLESKSLDMPEPAVRGEGDLGGGDKVDEKEAEDEVDEARLGIEPIARNLS